MRIGTWTTYYENGTLKSQGAYQQRHVNGHRVVSNQEGYWVFKDIWGRLEEASGTFYQDERIGN